ncbi:UDP-N-acetylmuramate dehydrogenase [Marinomonas sp. A79]|uniref:UDP-N-acetylenolpyruvoylglucosamine reductase n=1 Tax=Marinomonas vulgaris TaxID=2823372 RepID=A0ABS5HA06_9GAMM|nr:UDP-N-acetylmuramate dehydrogenase [Marinomonas vulgaris]MBR7888508.1 UDP-N-acetylmuramate dehydrogenase [Marinomonas vulgaris]
MTDDALQAIEASLQKQVSLASYNTFRFDYPAEYFAVADSLEYLATLLQWANAADQPVTMIGGGSNLLICGAISGLVIINRLKGIDAVEHSNGSVTVTASAGENWHQLVRYTVEQGWHGIENLALIPGTAGAAPVQNIGAYGVEVKDVLTRIQVINTHNGSVFWMDANECGFAYRDSFFKQQWKSTLLITAIELTLHKESELTLEYGGLSAHLSEKPSLQEVFELVCRVRSEKLPDPSELPNAGSFFKNPVVSQTAYENLKTRFENLVAFPVAGGMKLAAGWLIDHAGWKGKVRDRVGVYDKQALVLVNYSDISAAGLLALESDIKASVFERYGVLLEREPVLLPESARKLELEQP